MRALDKITEHLAQLLIGGLILALIGSLARCEPPELKCPPSPDIEKLKTEINNLIEQELNK